MFPSGFKVKCKNKSLSDCLIKSKLSPARKQEVKVSRAGCLSLVSVNHLRWLPGSFISKCVYPTNYSLNAAQHIYRFHIITTLKGLDSPASFIVGNSHTKKL